jgi:flagellar hook-associated protein 3 FlgL
MTLISSTINAAVFLDGVSRLQKAQTRTQEDISSGFRVRDAADSPEQIQELVGLVTTLSGNQSWRSNLGRVEAEATAADSALTTAITLVESARTLAQQGAGSLATTAERQTLAAQVRSIQQQIVSLANTTTEGRYIFGGDQDLSPPYQINTASIAGADKLTLQTSTRVISDPSGQPVYQSSTAAVIFDHRDHNGAPAADNVLGALQTLAVALGNNDSSGAAGALQSLKSGSDWLNQQQSNYGISLNRIHAEQSAAENHDTSLRSRIGAIRDTDIVQAATDLSAENTAQSAAFAAQARISGKSLFDYLG